jgi:hypothetical protein
MQVLEMDERFRASNGHDPQRYKAIGSINCTNFSDNIYLRGAAKGLDYNIVSTDKLTRPDVISSLRDWDEHWSGWGTPEYPTIEQCCRAGSIETGGYFEFPTTPDEVEKVMKEGEK